MMRGQDLSFRMRVDIRIKCCTFVALDMVRFGESN